MYDKNFLLHNWYYSQSTASSGDASEIDYEALEDAYYNALVRYNNDNTVYNADPESDVVNFATGTDVNMYTGSTVVAPRTTAQQQTMYLLDIRNCLIIFLGTYFLITMYSRLKNTLSNYYSGKE